MGGHGDPSSGSHEEHEKAVLRQLPLITSPVVSDENLNLLPVPQDRGIGDVESMGFRYDMRLIPDFAKVYFLRLTSCCLCAN